MVSVRAIRQGIEVLYTPPKAVGLNRLEMAAMVGEDGTGPVDVVRQGAEALFDAGAVLALNRLEAEAMVGEDGTGPVDVVRQGAEVLFDAGAHVGLNRLELAAMVGEDGTGAVSISRQGFEVLFRSSILPGPPLDLPSGFEMFLHNWLNGFNLDGAYMTDVTLSQTTGAQERRALRQKPLRTVNAVFLNSSREEIDRLLVVLRRLTSERFPFPLFCDEAPLTGPTTTSNDYVLCDTRYRRFFTNGRVLIAPHTGNHVTAAEVQTKIIQEVLSDRLVFTTALSANVDTNYSVYPLVDCEMLLAPEATMHTHLVAETELNMTEVLGYNTLPPTRSDTPEGFTDLEGYPIFAMNSKNDFTRGVSIRFVRQGDTRFRGRGPVVSSNQPKWQMEIGWNLIAENRAAAWKMIQFFDSRRGRARGFWVMDEEDLWDVLDVQPTFVSIDPLGEFADFQDVEVIGIELTDGTIYARRVVTIQEILGVWRLTTTGGAWPAIDVADIKRVARVRLSSFTSDNLTEQWSSLEVCQFRFKTIENLDEGEKTT